MRYHAALLFGAPGSGKGTQGRLIGQLPGFLHTSTGDLFRALDRDSEIGRVFVEYSSKGMLVPDDFTIRLWREHMQKMVQTGAFDPAQDLVLMDGVPRTENQARLLDEVVQVRKIIYLDAHNIEKMVARLKTRAAKEGRADDADVNVIRQRMDVYANNTAPVLRHYRRELIAKIEADQSVLRVFSDVVQALVPVKEAIERGELIAVG